jgi:hypothetical protein
MPALPMGGVGDSGYSRARGEEGLLTFSRSRSLYLRRGTGLRELWWFPYGPKGRRLLRALLGWEQHGGVRGLLSVFVRLFDRDAR